MMSEIDFLIKKYKKELQHSGVLMELKKRSCSRSKRELRRYKDRIALSVRRKNERRERRAIDRQTKKKFQNRV
jgi:tRNA threonylcarbamoyladenosine modification (KEOPS) complex  Pcc1 subunit